MYKLIVSELAHQDLDGIVYYVATELSNPIAARNFLGVVTTKHPNF
jgi:toxin ParE1/3/4